MSPGPARVAVAGDLAAVLLAPPRRERPRGRRPPSSPSSTTPTTAFAESTEPHWIAWRHALAARRALIESDPDAAAEDVAAAREALDKCAPSADTALAMAYLAHVEVTADHFDAAMLLAVDASLLTEGRRRRRARPGRCSRRTAGCR